MRGGMAKGERLGGRRGGWEDQQRSSGRKGKTSGVDCEVGVWRKQIIRGFVVWALKWLCERNLGIVNALG